jgi:hypothetical protein
MQFKIVRYEQIRAGVRAPKRASKRPRKVCRREGPIRGVGDMLARVLGPGARMLDSMLGTALEDCDQCKARRRFLNRLLPFSSGSK